jgi:hypothetical protein
MQEMMIAKNWTNYSVTVAGHRCPSLQFSPLQKDVLERSSADCQVSATVRSRTAMKGGELNGHEKGR